MAWYDHKFSNQYEEAKRVLQNPAPFDSGEKGLLASLSKVMTDTGFDTGRASTLDDLRKTVTKGKSKGFLRGNEALPQADGILRLAGVSNGTGEPTLDPAARKRAAALKFLCHVYLLKQRGSHKVWLHSLPTAFSDWAHWALDSGTGGAVKTLLGASAEPFSLEQRKDLSNATQEGLKWCQKALLTLTGAAGGKADPLGVVKRWFADETTTAEQLNTYISTLTAGFKAITAAINRGQIVLTDFPTLRGATGGSEAGLRGSEAFVWALASREKLDVVYVEDAFFGTSNTLQGLANWARILVHELSHLVCGTEDVEPGPRYSWYGIGPNAAGFPGSDAVRNADSWAFFAGDCSSALASNEVAKALVKK